MRATYFHEGGPFSFASARYSSRAAMKLPLFEEGRKDMKKQAFGIFAMLTLLLAVGVASVNAQSQRTLNIPFSFNVGHKSLPAGEYIVQPNRTDSQNVWLLKMKDGSAKVAFTTVSARAEVVPGKTKLVFHKYDNQYFLSQVWTPGNNSGRELRRPRAERELLKNGTQRQMVDLKIDGTE
jgi:hypothetical protein